MIQIDPQHAIVPILGGDATSAITKLLGTGFFVGTPETRHLITAKHVFDDNPIGEDEHYSFAFRVGERIGIHRILKVYTLDAFDVAACPAPDLEGAESLCFCDEQPSLNEDVFSFEYSSTRLERKSSGGLHVTFEPLSHKGNVMRFYTSTYPESRPTPSLQVSYPALQGASGAPVIATRNRKEFYVAGILVANIERELLPAQVVRIEEPGKYTEETKYFLPHAKALDCRIARGFLEGLGIEDLYLHENDA